VFLYSFLFTFSTSFAETNLKIPAEYGEVIYQCNAESPSQIYVIGMSHRDSLTRLNGPNTPRVQAEVYQIGDWLVRHLGLELLLPEGFFKAKKAQVVKADIKTPKECPSPVDMKVLEERLADNRTYVNAEMLLKEYHSLKTEQVEDKVFYDAVGAGISKLVKGPGNSTDYLLLKSELDYLQERRTAAMIQKIPEIVDLEFRQGSIKSRKAIFTIGLSHLHKIIQYLNEKRITVCPSPFTSDKAKDFIAEPDLLKANFGVCVILPKTLANDGKALELNRLNYVVSKSRSRAPFSNASLLP
jgi:hypothetical protein